MISDLPEYLLERTRSYQRFSPKQAGELQQAGDQQHPGEYVLYWMRNAIRADENPALDVARLLAAKLDLPLLVYQGLSDDYAYASDRHHTFIIEGARDVQAALAEMGISYAFHLTTSHDQHPHLVTFASDASLVVTEDMPVDPARRYLQALAKQTVVPIYCVDTACVVPMSLTERAFTRAFAYRDATRKCYAERLNRPWPALELADRAFDLSKLPFASVDLQDHPPNVLVPQCDIDHSVGPVSDTTGGAVAGYERWHQFKRSGLNSYAKRRNDSLVDGVSRMSAYLHYGMVSPMRIAREAAAVGNAGAEKFLDELLIWRELSYAFCFHRADHDQWSALPDWAQETLQKHATDTRDKLYSWEELSRGATADSLWNAAQKSLVMHGELHNNLRMTWGKAILKWQQSPQQALATIFDLNHRYALDGRDPASYGGILWCLGQFDRPFEPEQSVIGRVRPRPIEVHAKRLDTPAYQRKVSRPRFAPVPHVAVIGAGLSGLMAARTLVDHGLRVTVFEKSHGVGGRMATRRHEDGSSFDHGAQYFTVRDERFRRYVESWSQQGLVAAWPSLDAGSEHRIVVLKNGAIASESTPLERFVGKPSMNAVCRHLAEGLELRKQTLVAKVQPVDGRTELIDEASQSLGAFDRLIVALPAEQAATLLRGFSQLSAQISEIEMRPCWAGMFRFAEPLPAQWVGAFLHDSFLSWAARNSTKPGRLATNETLVLHANPQWTGEHWEDDPGVVAQNMLDEFWRVSGVPCAEPSFSQSHRWRYALPAEQNDAGAYFDTKHQIAVCGDWAAGSRVEGAFLSGMAAAGRILGTLTPIRSGSSSQLTLF